MVFNFFVKDLDSYCESIFERLDVVVQYVLKEFLCCNSKSIQTSATVFLIPQILNSAHSCFKSGLIDLLSR